MKSANQTILTLFCTALIAFTIAPATEAAVPGVDEPLPTTEIPGQWVFVLIPDGASQPIAVNPIVFQPDASDGPQRFTMDVDIEGHVATGGVVQLIVTTEEVEDGMDVAQGLAETAKDTHEGSPVVSKGVGVASRTLAELTEEVQVDYGLVTFFDVPAVRGAEYSLVINGERHVIEPFVDGTTLLDPEGLRLETIPLASGCYSTTMNDFRWMGYGAGRETDTSSWSAKDLAWGAWKYGWEYWPACDYGQHHIVRPSFGFGFYGQNRLAQGIAHTTHFGGIMDGETWTRCHNYGSYSGYKCHGHIATIHSPKFFYRINNAEGVEPYQAKLDGRASSSCATVMPDEAKKAIAIPAFRYSWLGVASFIPSEVCKTNWRTVETDRGPGLGVQVTGTRSAGPEKHVAGGITMKYSVARIVEPEIMGVAFYNLWMQACDQCSNSVNTSGGNYYSLKTPLRVV